MDRVERYLRDLESSSTLVRKFAARYLKDCPDPRALAPLAKALADPEPDVRKEAADTLAAVGDASVTPALERARKDAETSVAAAARAALIALESRRAPPAPSPAPAGAAPAGPGPLDRAGIVREALAAVDAEAEDRGYGVRATVQLPRGRKQVVRIVYDRADPDGDPIVLVMTVCGPAEPRTYTWALKTNNRLPYGALAVRPWKGADMLVLRETFLESDLTAEALRKAVLLLAEKGDWVESQLNRTDSF